MMRMKVVLMARILTAFACGSAARASPGSAQNRNMGDDTVGNPQIVRFELFELILLFKLDKQLPVEQFEATVSQSRVPAPPPFYRRRGRWWRCSSPSATSRSQKQVYVYIYIYIYIYTYTYIYIYIVVYVYIDIYIYIYIERERYIYIHICIYIHVCICIYIYIHVHTYIQRRDPNPKDN